MDTPLPEPDVAASAVRAALDCVWQRAQHVRLTPEECQAALLLDRALALLAPPAYGLDVRTRPLEDWAT